MDTHMTHLKKLTLLCATALTLFGCAAELPPTDSDSSDNTGESTPDTATYVCGDAKITKAQIIEAINAARAQARSCGTQAYTATTPINWDNRLFLTADKHSKDLATNNFFSHTGSDGSSVGQRARTKGYTWNFIAENIAAGQTSLDQVVTGWLNSPGHCRNMMNPNAQDIGLSCRYDQNTDYKTYWTLVLGRSF